MIGFSMECIESIQKGISMELARTRTGMDTFGLQVEDESGGDRV